MKLPALAMLALVAGAPAPAWAQAPVSDAQRVDNLCRLNPASAVCQARLQGKAATGGLDLAAAVAKGEGWRTSPETRGEKMACWATLKAIQERIAASGPASWPKSYTPAALGQRAADWAKIVKAAYDGLEERRPDDERKALEEARAQIAGPNIVYAAETAGNCKAE